VGRLRENEKDAKKMKLKKFISFQMIREQEGTGENQA